MCVCDTAYGTIGSDTKNCGHLATPHSAKKGVRGEPAAASNSIFLRTAAPSLPSLNPTPAILPFLAATKPQHFTGLLLKRTALGTATYLVRVLR